MTFPVDNRRVDFQTRVAGAAYTVLPNDGPVVGLYGAGANTITLPVLAMLPVGWRGTFVDLAGDATATPKNLVAAVADGGGAVGSIAVDDGSITIEVTTTTATGTTKQWTVLASGGGGGGLFAPIQYEYWVDPSAPAGGNGAVSNPFNLLADALALCTIAFPVASYVIRVGYGNYTVAEGVLVVPATGAHITFECPHTCLVSLTVETGSMLVNGAAPFCSFSVAATALAANYSLYFLGGDTGTLEVGCSLAPGSITVEAENAEALVLTEGVVVSKAINVDVVQSSGAVNSSVSTAINAYFDTPMALFDGLGAGQTDFTNCIFAGDISSNALTNTWLGCKFYGVGAAIGGDGRGIGQQTLYLDGASWATLQASGYVISADFTVVVWDGSTPGANQQWWTDGTISGNALRAANGTQNFPFPTIQQSINGILASAALNGTVYTSGATLGGSAGAAIVGQAVGTPTAAVLSFAGGVGVLLAVAGSVIVTDSVTGDTWSDDGANSLIALGGDAANGAINYDTGTFNVGWGGAGSPGNALTVDFTPLDSAIVVDHATGDPSICMVGAFRQNGTFTFTSPGGQISLQAAGGVFTPSALTTGARIGSLVFANADTGTFYVVMGPRSTIASSDCSTSHATTSITWYLDQGSTISGSMTDHAAGYRSNYISYAVGALVVGTIYARRVEYASMCYFVGGLDILHSTTSYISALNACKSGSILCDLAYMFIDGTTSKYLSNSGVIPTGTASYVRGGISNVAYIPAATSVGVDQTITAEYNRVYVYTATAPLNVNLPDANTYGSGTSGGVGPKYVGEEIAVVNTDGANAITLVPFAGDTLIGSTTVTNQMAVLKQLNSNTWLRYS